MGVLLFTPDDPPRTVVVDDFESGALRGWQSVEKRRRRVVGGLGCRRADSEPSFGVPAPPGKFAILTELRGPGTRILYRDLELDGRFVLHATVFHASRAGVQQPANPVARRRRNQQFRIDLVRPSAPIDSVAKPDVLVNVFRTAPGDSGLHHPST